MKHRTIESLVVGVGVLLTSLPALGQCYEFEWLDDMSAEDSRANDINDAGEIVGRLTHKDGSEAVIWDAQGNPEAVTDQFVSSWFINEQGHIAGGRGTAFFWSPETGLLELGTLGGEYTWVMAMNDLDQVVGQSLNADGLERAYIWDPVNGIQYLGTILAKSVALDINNKGQVVGTSYDGFFDPNTHVSTLDFTLEEYGVEIDINTKPFVWDAKKGLIDLVDSDLIFGTARAINESGLITGFVRLINIAAPNAAYYKAEPPAWAGWVWSQDGKVFSEGRDLNENGDVTGWLDVDGDPWDGWYQRNPFVYGRDIGLVQYREGGWIGVQINERGEALAEYPTIEYRYGMLCIGGQAIRQGGLIPGNHMDGGWRGWLNNHGVFVGTAHDLCNGISKAYVVRPIDVVGDLDGDCSVGVIDLIDLLGAWGKCLDCDDCPADLDGDCAVTTGDLIILLGNWQ